MSRYYLIAATFVFFVLTAASDLRAFEIGHTTHMFYDTSRNREIDVEIYYPANTSGEDAPSAEGAFPFIVFGHGFTIPWSDYEYVKDMLTPEGYIIVYVDTETGFSPSHEAFGRDLSYVTNHFPDLGEDPGSIFFNHVGVTSAVMGHSMGGGASFLAIDYGASATALANFAAAETNPSAEAAAANIDIPTLMFCGTEDCVTPPEDHQIPIYNALNSDCKSRITITGASHCQFAQNNFNCTVGEFFAGCSADIDLEVQESITIQYLLSWLNYMLKNDYEAWQTFESDLAAGQTAGTITYEHDCTIPTPAPTATATPTDTPFSLFTPTPTPTEIPEEIPALGNKGVIMVVCLLTVLLAFYAGLFSKKTVFPR